MGVIKMDKMIDDIALYVDNDMINDNNIIVGRKGNNNKHFLITNATTMNIILQHLEKEERKSKINNLLGIEVTLSKKENIIDKVKKIRNGLKK